MFTYLLTYSGLSLVVSADVKHNVYFYSGLSPLPPATAAATIKVQKIGEVNDCLLSRLGSLLLESGTSRRPLLL